MALKSYILTKDFKSPYVTSTGLPHNPQAIRFKQFKKGEVITGEMKHANNKPAFVLVNGVCVVPLEVIKELVTKEIVSQKSKISNRLVNLRKTIVLTFNLKDPIKKGEKTILEYLETMGKISG